MPIPAIPTLDELLGHAQRSSLAELSAGARLLPQPAPASPYASLPDLTPEEEASILSQLGHGSLSVLGYLGGVLDKATGARTLRGILGGHPREMLNAIPFSDLLGITRREDIVSGSDLTSHLLGENEPGFSSRDVLDFGVEVGLDPGTYLTLGTTAALSGAGKVVKAAGALKGLSRAERVTSKLDDILRTATPELRTSLERAAGGTDELTALAAKQEPLSGLASVGAPFGIGPQYLLGTGETGQKIASKLDVAGDYLKFKNPVGRTLGSMFDYERRNVLSEPGQRTQIELTNLNRASNARSGTHVVDVYRELEPLAKMVEDGTLTSQKADSFIRRGMEGVAIPASELDPASEAALGLQRAVALDRPIRAEIHSRLTGKGFDIGTITDQYVDYFHRTATVPAKKWIKRLQDRLFPMEFEGAKSRADYLQNIPGGTETINDFVADPRLAGKNRTFTDNEVYTHIVRVLGGGEGSPAQAQAIRDWLKELPDDLVGQRLYRDTLRDMHVYNTQGLQTADAVDKYLDFVSDVKLGAVNGTAQGDFVKVTDAVKASRKFGVTDLNQPTADYLAQRLGTTVDKLDEWIIPKHIKADANRFINGFTAPDSLQPVLGAYDWMTQAFKTGVTTPWPGFNSRNLMTGMWMAYVGGARDPRFKGPKSYYKPWIDQHTLIGGKTVDGMSANPLFRGLNLTDEEATRRMGEIQYAHGLNIGTIGQEVQGVLADKSPVTLSAIGNQIPGRRPVRPLRDYLAALNPVGKGLRDIAASPVRAGEGLTNAVENMNRGSMFQAFTWQGMDPAVAAARAKELNVNYLEAAGTEFERHFAKRAIPFYSFAKGMIPLQLKELAEHPGGPVRQAIRLTESTRDDSGFAPQYLKDKLAIPLGGENEDGTQRYITQLDLPHEALNDVGTGSGILGMFNPMLKAPMEILTGQSFFSGRDLRDLDPRTGRILENTGIINDAKSVPYWLDTLVGATPAARVLTSVGQVVEPRKGLVAKAINLGTGVRLSDVDLNKQRQIAARELLTESLRGRPGVGTFTKLYVDDPEKLSPEDWLLLRVQSTQRRRYQKEQRAAKKQSDLQNVTSLPSL